MKNLIYGNVFLENNISNSSQNILTFFHLFAIASLHLKWSGSKLFKSGSA